MSYPITHLRCAGFDLDLSRPRIMGILNVTPDSFSDGGRFHAIESALAQARRMVEEGADILDVGGESTRPGAHPVSEQEELDRVIPVIEAIARELPACVSVDTSKPAVMAAAVAAGAGLVNDVYALRADGALQQAAALDIPVCLMHMQGEPRTMQADPHYGDVVKDVCAFLAERIATCERAGISRERLLVDPGFGFGKRIEHNYSLLKHLPEIGTLGVPVLVGMSRKSMIGSVLDRSVGERVTGSVTAAALAAWLGAKIVRVHDVKPTVEALKIIQAAKTAV